MTYLNMLAVRLPEQSTLQTLVNGVDIGWILVHLDEMGNPARRKVWTSGSLRGLELVQRWGDDLLFAVVLPVMDDRRALFVSTDRTLSDLPLAPVGSLCPGRVSAVVRGAGQPLTPGAKLPLHLQIDNQSSATWPGFGLYPRYLVQLRSTFQRDGARVGPAQTTVLWQDVPAGGSSAIETDLLLPARPGAYQLELALEQDGESLERCGLIPARLDLLVEPASAPLARAR
jgi:hypothetical protein